MDEDPADSYWERMPPAFREECRAKRAAKARLEHVLDREMWRYRWKYAIAGAFLGSIWNLAQGAATPGFRIALLLVCAGSALLIAHRRMDMFAGIFTYGAPAVALSVFGQLSGMVGFHSTASYGNLIGIMFTLLSWLMFLVTGGFLAFIAELEHERRWRTN